MYLIRIKILYVLFILGIIISSCSTSKKTVSSNKDQPVFPQANFAKSTQTKKIPSIDKNGLSEEVRIKAERIFMDANKAKILGDFQQAIALFSEAIRLDQNNDAAKYELANIYWNSGQKDMAMYYAKGAAELKQGNKWYQRLYAETLAANGKFREAATVYEQLTKRNPDDYDYYLDHAYMLLRANQLEDALNVYNELEKKVGVDEEISMQKQRIYLKMGKIDKAVAEIEKLILDNPKEPRYYGMLAELFDANNLPEKAMEQLQKVLEIDPDNPNAYLAIAEYYRKKNDQINHINYLSKAFESPNLDIDSKIKILFPYLDSITIDSSKQSQAFLLGELLVKTHPDEAKAHAMYGDLFFQLDSLEKKAKEQYEIAIRLDENRITVWLQLIQIEAKQDNWNEVENKSQKVMDLFPNQLYGYYFSGAAKKQLKKYNESIAVLEKSVNISSEDNKLLSDIHAMLGENYNDLKKYVQSDSSFQKAILLFPANYNALNNYSYYLSLRGEHLEEAEKMSLKSNQLKPNESAYEDTYAWILYKMKKYSEAKSWQEKAIKHGGENKPTLLEHYGDILFQLGDIDAAVDNWKKARQNGAESILLSKKIADRKLYEDMTGE